MEEKANEESAVIYVSHYVTPGTLLEYYKIKKDLNEKKQIYWMYQGKNAPSILKRKSIKLIRFGKRDMTRWSRAMNGRGIVPGNSHVLLFKAKEKLNGEYFWFIEYDVRFKNRWGEVLNQFDKDEYDLLSSFLQIPFKDKSWEHWKSINLPYNKFARSFNPLCRVSRNLLSRIESLLEDGYWAHHETLLASTCYNESFGAKDIGKILYKRKKIRLYERMKWNSAKESYNYRPAKVTSVFEKKNKLVHPVKPLKWFTNKYGFFEGAKKYLKIIYVQSKKVSKKC